MVRIAWDAYGSRTFEAGVDRAVIYPPGSAARPWNGLVSVEEAFVDTLTESIYFDGRKVGDKQVLDDFTAVVQAYTYPSNLMLFENEAITGVAPRRAFGMVYRTLKGNDILGTDYGYQLHLVYNAVVEMRDPLYQTLNELPNAVPFSWDLTTRKPIDARRFAPTSHLVLDSTIINSGHLQSIENILYGTATTNPRLPSPEELITLLDAWTGGYGWGRYGHTVYGNS